MTEARRGLPLAWLLVAPQLAIWGVLWFLPVTLHGGRGVDVSVAVLLACASALILLVSAIVTYRTDLYRSGSWSAVAVQLSIPACVFAGHYALEQWRMPSFRDAADHQHLVGATRADAERELGTYGAQVTTVRRGTAPPEVWLHYPGMKLVVDESGRVVAVEPRR